MIPPYGTPEQYERHISETTEYQLNMIESLAAEIMAVVRDSTITQPLMRQEIGRMAHQIQTRAGYMIKRSREAA